MESNHKLPTPTHRKCEGEPITMVQGGGGGPLAPGTYMFQSPELQATRPASAMSTPGDWAGPGKQIP